MARTQQFARGMGAKKSSAASALPASTSQFVEAFDAGWRSALHQQRQQRQGDVALPTHLRILPLPFARSENPHLHQYEVGNSLVGQMLNSQKMKEKSHTTSDEASSDSNDAKQSGRDEVDGADGEYSCVMYPHLLVSESAFSQLVHNELPDCQMLLVDVHLTFTSDGRHISSSQLTQSQFDEALGQCEGQAEVKGTLAGLGAFRFNLFLYSDMQVTFTAQLSRSNDSPLGYIVLIALPAIQAANEAKKTGTGPLAQFREKPTQPPRTLEFFIQRQLEENNRERYRQNRWTTGVRLMKEDMEALPEEERKRMTAAYEAEEKAVVDWDKDYKQIWIEMADRHSPLVRPRLCAVDDSTIQLKAQYHLTASLELPVVCSGLSIADRSNMMTFRVDEAALPTTATAARDGKAERSDEAQLGPIELVGGVRRLRVTPFPLSAIQDFHAERRHVEMRMDDLRSAPTENAETFLDVLKQRFCSPPVASLTISHLDLDNVILRCSKHSSTAQYAFVLADTLRLPFLQTDVQQQPTLQMIAAFDQITGIVNPRGYTFALRGGLLLPSGSSVEVTLGNKREDQIQLYCADSRDACALYDKLLTQSTWWAEQQALLAAQQRSPTSSLLPLVDCIAQYFPLLDFPPAVSATTDAQPGHLISDPALELSGRSSIKLNVDATFEKVTLLLVDRITLQAQPESGVDEAPLFVTLSSPPNWGHTGPKQRGFLLTPQLLSAKPSKMGGWQRELRSAGSVTLRRWLRIAALTSTLSSLPLQLQRSIEITGGTIVFRLNGSGHAEWQTGCASTGTSSSDVVVHYHNWSGALAKNITWTNQESTVDAALQTFVRVEQFEQITPQRIPYLLDAVQGRALAPLYHYTQCVMPANGVLGRDGVRQLEGFVIAACDAGQKPWNQWLSTDTQQLVPQTGFVAAQPHLPFGQLLIPVPTGQAEDVKMEEEHSALSSTPSTVPAQTKARPPVLAKQSLILALMDMHGVIMVLLDLVDSNSIIYGLSRVNRQTHAAVIGLTTSLGADYWHQHFIARFARYCGTQSNELWKEATLRSWRDQLVQRLERKRHEKEDQSNANREDEPRRKRQQVQKDKEEPHPSNVPMDWAKQSLFAHSPYYAAAVDFQCRFNAFHIRTLLQPAHLVLPQCQEEPSAEDVSATSQSGLYPPRLYSLPEAIKPVLCLTPPFCADLRPDFVGDVKVQWASPYGDCSLSVVVPSSPPPHASTSLHPYFLPFMQARPGESDISVWSLYTGPTYVWDDIRHRGEGVSVSTEAVDAFFTHTRTQRPNQPVQLPPARPVRLVFLRDGEALPVTRMMPQLERHLKCYSSSMERFLQQKGVLAKVAQIQKKWMQAAEKAGGKAVDAEKVAAKIDGAEREERGAAEMEGGDDGENEHEDGVVMEDGPICLPLMNALLNEYRYHMRVGRQ